MAVTHHTLSVAVCTSKHTISKWGRTEKHIVFILCPYTIELHRTLQQPAEGSPTFILRQKKNQPHYMQLETKTQRPQQLENSTKKVGLNSSLYQRWLQRESPKKHYSNNQTDILSVLAKPTQTQQEWVQSYPCECHPQSIRPSPSLTNGRAAIAPH